MIALVVVILVVTAGGMWRLFEENIQEFTPQPIEQPQPAVQTDMPEVVRGSVPEQAVCKTPPTLSMEEVVSITKNSRLSRQANGWWKVSYRRGTSWNGNPFHDECIWAVRSYAPAPKGSDFGSYALDMVFVSDSTKELR